RLGSIPRNGYPLGPGGRTPVPLIGHLALAAKVRQCNAQMRHWLAAASVAALAVQAPVPSDSTLWYTTPPSEWTEALPIGNGRVGAMVFGGITHERLQLNEGTLWAGRPYDPVNPDAKDALPEVRRLIGAGQYRDAATLASQKVMAKPLRQMPYETLGSLRLTFPDAGGAEGYRRDLDLATATAHVSYVTGGV